MLNKLISLIELMVIEIFSFIFLQMDEAAPKGAISDSAVSIATLNIWNIEVGFIFFCLSPPSLQI